MKILASRLRHPRAHRVAAQGAVVFEFLLLAPILYGPEAQGIIAKRWVGFSTRIATSILPAIGSAAFRSHRRVSGSPDTTSIRLHPSRAALSDRIRGTCRCGRTETAAPASTPQKQYRRPPSLSFRRSAGVAEARVRSPLISQQHLQICQRSISTGLRVVSSHQRFNWPTTSRRARARAS